MNFWERAATGLKSAVGAGTTAATGEAGEGEEIIALRWLPQKRGEAKWTCSAVGSRV